MYRTTLPPQLRRITALAALAGASALGGACSREGMPASHDSAIAGPAAVMEGTAGIAPAPARMAQPSDAAKVAAPAAQLPRGSGADSATPSMIIRNGFVSIQVDSLEIAVAAVRGLAARLGGYVGNVSMNTGEYAVRSATLELKIPAARFDEAMNTLSPIGKVEQSNSTAEDVGEEFVDVNARVANARRLEERLVTLLATRTGKLEDVLAVERELARVREEIERFEGRLRFLKSRVSMSTLSVTVHEKAPLVSPTPGTSVLGEAVKAMWRNFVHLVASVIASLGVVIPVAALLGAAAWAWRRRQRGGRSGGA